MQNRPDGKDLFFDLALGVSLNAVFKYLSNMVLNLVLGKYIIVHTKCEV